MARLNRNEVGAKVDAGNVVVSSSASQVVDQNSQRVSLSLRNNGETDLFFGFTASVTTVTGYPLLPDEEYEFVDYMGPVYVICATTGDLRYYEVY